MKKLGLLLLTVGMVSAASAVSLINTDFTSPYVNGNIAGQQSWANMPLTGGFSFEVDATAGVADTAPYAANFDTGGNSTNGHYVSLSPSVGNLVDDEWAGSMDFSLSTVATAGTNIASFSSAQEIFQIGLTDAVTNRLNSNAAGDLTIHLRYKGNGNAQVTLSKAGNFRTLGTMTDAQLGWDPLNVDTNTGPILTTDDLRLTWTLRKTRVADTYSAVAVISNLTSGAVSVFDPSDSVNFVTKTNAYPAANLTLAMGHDQDADQDGLNSLINIAIDSLSVDQTSGNVPVLETPALSASGGNQSVELSWSASLEATSYEVFRSLTSGSGFASIGTTNGTSFLDTGVVNDTVYYYFVRASETGAADVDSNEASAEPQAAATGSIVDTTFIASEGYANGDLNTQDRWKSATAGTAPVFQVTDAAGSGFADSEPYTNNFDSTLANDVYYNRLMSNNVGDVWNGSITFTAKAPPTPGEDYERIIDITDTNNVVIGQYTNTHTVAGMSGGELFKIGLTAAPDTGLDHSDANDIFFYVRMQSSGRLDFTFNSVKGSDRLFAVDKDVLGWDPNWTSTENSATNGPSFETDPITFNWKIRKTAETNFFLSDLSVIVGSVTNEPEVALPVVYGDSTDAYAADFVYLGMGMGEEADRGKTDQGASSGTVITTAVKSVSIDALSLTKADDQPPELLAPRNFLTDVADGTVFLNWDASIEATSYIVRRYSHYIGGTVDLETNVAANLTYTDTGLANGWSYFYTVAADYGVYGEAESARVHVRPLGKTTLMNWGPSTEIVTANENWDVTTQLTNGILNHIGSNPGGAMWIHGTGTYNTNAAPALYGISQLGDGAWAQRHLRDDEGPNHYDLIRLRTKSGSGATPGGYASSLIWVDSADFVGGTSIDLSAAGLFFESSNNDWTEEIGYGTLRTAVRNAGQWYVGETVHTDTGDTLIDLSAENWTTLTPADLNSTSMMTVSGQTFSVSSSSLTAVDAVGFFCDHLKSFYMFSWKITKGQQPTAFQMWADGWNIYNELPTDDHDGDGFSNVHEWGVKADPTDPNSLVRKPRSLGLDTTGTNLVYVYPRLETIPVGLSYTVQQDNDLVFAPVWSAVTPDPEVATGLWNTNSPGLGVEAVTNLIPTDLNTKFIGLEIKYTE